MRKFKGTEKNIIKDIVEKKRLQKLIEPLGGRDGWLAPAGEQTNVTDKFDRKAGGGARQGFAPIKENYGSKKKKRKFR